MNLAQVSVTHAQMLAVMSVTHAQMLAMMFMTHALALEQHYNEEEYEHDVVIMIEEYPMLPGWYS